MKEKRFEYFVSYKYNGRESGHGNSNFKCVRKMDIELIRDIEKIIKITHEHIDSVIVINFQLLTYSNDL